MKYVKLFESFVNEAKVDTQEFADMSEGKSVSEILAKLGEHGTKAVVSYLQDNPDLIEDVFSALVSNKDRKVRKRAEDLSRLLP